MFCKKSKRLSNLKSFETPDCSAIEKSIFIDDGVKIWVNLTTTFFY